VAAAFARLARHAAVDPALVLASGLRAGADLADVTVGRSSVQPAKGDKRFAHPAWAHNPIYRRLMQAYLVDATAVMRLVDEVDLDPKSRERARFALTLLVEALAPTNTLAGNPSALAKAVETRGRSLVTGLRHLAGDIRRNGGVPSTVDTRPFRVGDNIATDRGRVRDHRCRRRRRRGNLRRRHHDGVPPRPPRRNQRRHRRLGDVPGRRSSGTPTRPGSPPVSIPISSTCSSPMAWPTGR
jgi:Poly-beta-hydroxybutyrate polymerase (PhaC) N-terminus